MRGGVVGVLAVHAEEGDALAVGGGEPLEGGELEAAGAAPGGPDVDHDRVAAQRLDPLLVGVDAAVEQLVALPVEGRERRRRAGQRLRVVGMLAAVVAALLGAAAGGEQGSAASAASAPANRAFVPPPSIR